LYASATDSSAALPEPLSLMPGPAATLSRCEPSITTLLGSRPGSSAKTFQLPPLMVLNGWTVTVNPACLSWTCT
jgi:hypothetical protein